MVQITPTYMKGAFYFIAITFVALHSLVLFVIGYTTLLPENLNTQMIFVCSLVVIAVLLTALVMTAFMNPVLWTSLKELQRKQEETTIARQKYELLQYEYEMLIVNQKKR